MTKKIKITDTGGESKEFVTEIDDDLKIFALNWYFDNVEIAKNIEPCEEGEE